MNRKIRDLGLVALAGVMLLPAIAAAQAPPTPPTTVAPKAEALDARACSGSRTTVGKGGDLDIQKPQDKSLSQHLAQTGGVICPPGQVDPEIRVPTPPGGAMPVIPPPGSPGGDQSIQPK